MFAGLQKKKSGNAGGGSQVSGKKGKAEADQKKAISLAGILDEVQGMSKKQLKAKQEEEEKLKQKHEQQLASGKFKVVEKKPPPKKSSRRKRRRRSTKCFCRKHSQKI